MVEGQCLLWRKARRDYDVAVLWDFQPRYVLADAADIIPLGGMRLLHSYSLHIEVVDGARIAYSPERSDGASESTRLLQGLFVPSPITIPVPHPWFGEYVLGVACCIAQLAEQRHLY